MVPVLVLQRLPRKHILPKGKVHVLLDRVHQQHVPGVVLDQRRLSNRRQRPDEALVDDLLVDRFVQCVVHLAVPYHLDHFVLLVVGGLQQLLAKNLQRPFVVPGLGLDLLGQTACCRRILRVVGTPRSLDSRTNSVHDGSMRVLKYRHRSKR
uniref:(northern house mosquito) hypothetical protein n=1 Tax=Culex pipiens TaxID=7175 RepID=A0A8D8J6A8_CULPI